MGLASREIIGIVGGKQGNATPLAQALGEEATTSGRVLLTGGSPDPGSPEAKDAALHHAVLTAQRLPNHVARIFGILPDKSAGPGSAEVCWNLELRSNKRCLLIQTRLTSEERDVINGATPDAVIALEGGTGTILEVAFAVFLGVPVVFLDSFRVLSSKFNDRTGIVQTELAKACAAFGSKFGTGFTVSAVVAALSAHLAGPLAVLPSTGCHTADAAAALTRASALIATGGGVGSKGSFPDMPRWPNSQAEFQRLRELIEQ